MIKIAAQLIFFLMLFLAPWMAVRKKSVSRPKQGIWQRILHWLLD
jgi:hypothetical protein